MESALDMVSALDMENSREAVSFVPECGQKGVTF
jgi:hypothetical protein